MPILLLPSVIDKTKGHGVHMMENVSYYSQHTKLISIYQKETSNSNYHCHIRKKFLQMMYLVILYLFCNAHMLGNKVAHSRIACWKNMNSFHPTSQKNYAHLAYISITQNLKMLLLMPSAGQEETSVYKSILQNCGFKRNQCFYTLAFCRKFWCIFSWIHCVTSHCINIYRCLFLKHIAKT